MNHFNLSIRRAGRFFRLSTRYQVWFIGSEAQCQNQANILEHQWFEFLEI